MDFGTLPPEVNSTRMYTGPGSAPMLAAASAWRALATELRSAALGYQSVLRELTAEGWKGPAAAMMSAAAAPYITWMNDTAEQAEHTAGQATAAAAAFESAFAATVPPPVVAANRAQLAALVASNVLGQNTSAIAATEAYYGQMWSQDAAAMYGYAANSAAAATVTPFAPAQQTTNPAAQSNAATAAAGAGAQSTLSQVVTTTPTTLQALSTPLVASEPISTGDLTNAMTNLMSSSFSPMGMAGITQFGSDIAVIRGAALAAADPFGLGAMDPMDLMLPGMGHIFGGGAGAAAAAPAGLGLNGAATSAIVGRAGTVGALSVPAGWATSVPVAPPAASASLVSSWTSAVPETTPGGAPGMPGMPLAGSGAGRGYGFAAPRYGFKPTIMARPVVAG